MINDFRGHYRWLSNFWSCFVTYEGLTYPSTENAYQAQKFKSPTDRWKFLSIKASEAKQLGQFAQLPSDWNDRRLQIMYDLIKLKFTAEPLRSKLLDTGSEELQEGNWWGDRYWGTVNGVGENHLGKILMAVREELSSEQNL